jgi:hypothetical protein
MKQRGRKSAASFDIVPMNGKPSRLEPPLSLSKPERAMFLDLVNAADPDHFRSYDAILLCRYCEAVVLAEHAAKPPDHLPDTEASIFSEVVTSAPAGQFSPTDVYLLETFAQLTAAKNEAAKNLAEARTPKERQGYLKMLAEAAKTQALILQFPVECNIKNRAKANLKAKKFFEVIMGHQKRKGLNTNWSL